MICLIYFPPFFTAPIRDNNAWHQYWTLSRGVRGDSINGEQDVSIDMEVIVRPEHLSILPMAGLGSQIDQVLRVS